MEIIMNYREKLSNWWKSSSTRKKWRTVVFGGAGVLSLIFMALTSSPDQPSTGIENNLIGFSSTMYYVGVAIKTVGVLLLIVGAAVILKRYQNSKFIGGISTRKLQVLESTRLSQKQALHLVRAGEQYFLVGATDQNISVISQIQISPEKQTEVSSVQKGDFRSLLTQVMAKPSPSSTGQD